MLKLYVSLQNMLENISRDEKGQTAVEYGLVLAVISIVVVGVVAGLFAANGDIMTGISDKITTALGV
jgi:Flp pilus assembly pilin Flp